MQKQEQGRNRGFLDSWVGEIERGPQEHLIQWPCWTDEGTGVEGFSDTEG